jgi:hypothetical protein
LKDKRPSGLPIDSPRIAELRRRVEADPSSIAFAQLAEEYRRGGSFDEAVRICRAGLERHPGYLSARVTLGRALMELGELDDAELEFDLVLGTAPDNLAAIRGVAEISQRRGHLHVALGHYQRALSLARHDPDLEETVAQISRELGSGRPIPSSGMSFEQAQSELQSAADRMPLAGGEHPPSAPGTPSNDQAGNAEAAGDTPDSVTESPEAPVAGSQPFDFDGLLRTLGQGPSTPAPPVVEALLSGVPVPPGPLADHDTEGPGAPPPAMAAEPAAPAGDIPSGIEQDLGDFEYQPSGPDPGPDAPAEADASPQDLEDQVVLEDLERWLEVLERGSRSSSSAAEGAPAKVEGRGSSPTA